VSLNPATLRNALAPLFVPATMPRGDMQSCVQQWVSAYASYASAAIAGGLLPAAIVPTTASGPDFFTALDQALRQMWMAVAWAAPGLVGVTTVVPPLQPFLVASAPTIFASSDPQLAPTLIADALHTYTLSIVVTVTPATGAPYPAPLT